MIFDVAQSLQALSTLPQPVLPWPAGAPERDYIRSVPAARVGQLAASSGLFLFHFEHRAHRPLPLEFLPEGADPGLAEPPEWDGGRLPEAKYQSFRHDLMIGSFHPGHRGKWTTHELCHALVGFGFRTGASPLFHATAARLAELLPVVLYYFLDEVGVRRCPDHQGGGPLFRTYCDACEKAVEAGPKPTPQDREWLEDAARYLDRELAAVARTRRLGRPIAHRWGSLDLCTDGLAYAGSHGLRLNSEAFARFADGFLDDGAGCWSTLDALEERVVAVARALTEGAELASLAASAEVGRWTWASQDIGWRLIEASLELDGSVRSEADQVIEKLASAKRGSEALTAAQRAWPGPSDVWDVGYELGVARRSAGQLAVGVNTVCPLTLELFEDAGVDPIPAFLSADRPVRAPVGDRFAAWVTDAHSAVPGALAEFEAALRYASADTLSGILGIGEEPGIAPGVYALYAPVDPIELSEKVESGEYVGIEVAGRLVVHDLDGNELESLPTVLTISRDANGEIAVVELDDDDPVDLETQVALGMVTFTRWG